MRSYAFQSSAPQGSIFKLIGAYEGLRQGHSPLLVDGEGFDPKASAGKRQIVAYTPGGIPYQRIYKGGRLPKSSMSQIGKIDVLGALEHSSNPYFSVLAGDYLTDAEDLAHAARSFGYGEKSGLELPGEVAGNLPNDLKRNKTGLYSFAIGQHTLLNTPLQSVLMMSAIANGGKLLKPKIVKTVTGFTPDRKNLSAFARENGFAEEELKALGIPFSLFTGIEMKDLVKEIIGQSIEVRKMIPLSPTIRSQLLEGMDHALWSNKGNARPGIIRSLRSNPTLQADYLLLQHQMIGKTSTAEILYNPNLNPSNIAQMYKHIWFGALSFSPDHPIKVRYDYPELAIIVFSRFGDAGREGAPIAAQLIKRWREIQKKHSSSIQVPGRYTIREK